MEPQAEPTRRDAYNPYAHWDDRDVPARWTCAACGAVKRSSLSNVREFAERHVEEHQAEGVRIPAGQPRLDAPYVLDQDELVLHQPA